MTDYSLDRQEILRNCYDTATQSLKIRPVYKSVLSTDLTYSGTVVSDIVAGEDLVFGNLVYLKSDGKWWKADADAASSCGMLGMALATIATSASGNVALGPCFVRNDAWNWTVAGALYASTDAGAVTQSQPTGTDDVIQVVGWAVHADRIYFNPSMDYMTHT